MNKKLNLLAKISILNKDTVNDHQMGWDLISAALNY